ncbi:hypothetical protein B296_00007375 [Ensete ventricosum]|uniref:Uncharacterized protein n=1 Tax=Ensete ventricosum TaxID=4639 RepID=A0A426ZS78_ENSVE|nr:hypothetical protein B296_00007375 [Ensete ventricosum]
MHKCRFQVNAEFNRERCYTRHCEWSSPQLRKLRFQANTDLSEQDERQVGYSPRGEEAPSGAPTGKKGHRERLTMAETRLDILEASVEELYQGQGSLLGVESSQEEAKTQIENVESLIDQLTKDTKDSVRHLHEVVAELTAKVMVLIRTLDAGGNNTPAAPPQHFRPPEP